MDRLGLLGLGLLAALLGGCAANPPKRGSVAGRVEDAAGKPVPRAAVVILDSTAKEPYPALAAETDANGAFSLPGLPPGTYRIKASHAERGEGEQKVRVDSGGAAKASLVLRR